VRILFRYQEFCTSWEVIYHTDFKTHISDAYKKPMACAIGYLIHKSKIG
jgi:hypothetical protein